jgi:hypothetical protein
MALYTNRLTLLFNVKNVGSPIVLSLMTTGQWHQRHNCHWSPIYRRCHCPNGRSREKDVTAALTTPPPVKKAVVTSLPVSSTQAVYRLATISANFWTHSKIRSWVGKKIHGKHLEVRNLRHGPFNIGNPRRTALVNWKIEKQGKAHRYRKWKNKEEKVNLSDPWKSVLDNHEANATGGKTYTSSLNICPEHPISQLIIRKIIKRRRNPFISSSVFPS